MAVPLDPDAPGENAVYLEAITLFGQGYYWEAHERWEAVWHASGRESAAGLFVQGLIRLCAAGVKVRQGQPDGVRSHGEGAARLFDRVAAMTGRAQCCGMSLQELAVFARAQAKEPPRGGSLDQPVWPTTPVSRPS